MEQTNLQASRGMARQVSERIAHTAGGMLDRAQDAAGNMLTRAHDTLSPGTRINVGDMERLASTIGGTLLVVSGLGRGSFMGSLVALAGGALVHRGLTGHCAVYDRLGRDTAHTDMPRRMQFGPTTSSPQLVSDGVLGSIASGA
jgi:hypothetical protein